MYGEGHCCEGCAAPEVQHSTGWIALCSSSRIDPPCLGGAWVLLREPIPRWLLRCSFMLGGHLGLDTIGGCLVFLQFLWLQSFCMPATRDCRPLSRTVSGGKELSWQVDGGLKRSCPNSLWFHLQPLEACLLQALMEWNTFLLSTSLCSGI